MQVVCSVHFDSIGDNTANNQQLEMENVGLVKGLDDLRPFKCL